MEEVDIVQSIPLARCGRRGVMRRGCGGVQLGVYLRKEKKKRKKEREKNRKRQRDRQTAISYVLVSR